MSKTIKRSLIICILFLALLGFASSQNLRRLENLDVASFDLTGTEPTDIAPTADTSDGFELGEEGPTTTTPAPVTTDKPKPNKKKSDTSDKNKPKPNKKNTTNTTDKPKPNKKNTTTTSNTTDPQDSDDTTTTTNTTDTTDTTNTTDTTDTTNSTDCGDVTWFDLGVGADPVQSGTLGKPKPNKKKSNTSDKNKPKPNKKNKTTTSNTTDPQDSDDTTTTTNTTDSNDTTDTTNSTDSSDVTWFDLGVGANTVQSGFNLGDEELGAALTSFDLEDKDTSNNVDLGDIEDGVTSFQLEDTDTSNGVDLTDPAEGGRGLSSAATGVDATYSNAVKSGVSLQTGMIMSLVVVLGALVV